MMSERAFFSALHITIRWGYVRQCSPARETEDPMPATQGRTEEPPAPCRRTPATILLLDDGNSTVSTRAFFSASSVPYSGDSAHRHLVHHMEASRQTSERRTRYSASCRPFRECIPMSELCLQLTNRLGIHRIDLVALRIKCLQRH